ncbi:hypothetical protein M514_19933, partial [Trichuris suis]
LSSTAYSCSLLRWISSNLHPCKGKRQEEPELESTVISHVERSLCVMLLTNPFNRCNEDAGSDQNVRKDHAKSLLSTKNIQMGSKGADNRRLKRK